MGRCVIDDTHGRFGGQRWPAMGAVRGGGKSPAAHDVVTPGMTLPLGNNDGEVKQGHRLTGAQLATAEAARANGGVEWHNARSRGE
jgi:hypothetical protein